jgi:chromate transporter
METLRRNKALSAALAAITAAVVGIILNLAVWFALHVLFSEVRKVSGFGMSLDVPVLSSVNIPSLVLTVCAVVAVFRFKIGLLTVLAASALVGMAYGLTFGVYQ